MRYGATIRLHHVRTGKVLHSHPHNYSHEASSGQQQVTCFQGDEEENDYWLVRGPHGAPEGDTQGQELGEMAVVRLTHKATRRNLHSHEILAPVTGELGQHEVSAYGDDGEGDENDDWMLATWNGDPLQHDAIVTLTHIATRHRLHSHGDESPGGGYSHDEQTMGQQEVTAFPWGDANDFWRVQLVEDAQVASEQKPFNSIRGLAARLRRKR